MGRKNFRFNYHGKNWQIAWILMLGLSIAIRCQSNHQPESAKKLLNPVEPKQVESVMTIYLPGLPSEAKPLELQLIPSGTFSLGSSVGERGREMNSEWLAHPVTIPQPFYIGKYEITQAQWEAVMGEDSHHSKFKGRPNHPVEKVNWIDAQRFIGKLNELGQGKFRLPTEAEWEYACRAGTQTRFFWGDSLEAANTFMWWRGNSADQETHKVGQKTPNPWGLYDMPGNVSEWCADQWEEPLQRNAYINTPQYFSNWEYVLLLRNRVYRGGSIDTGIESCRSAARFYEQSIDYHYSLGLRVVRECDE